MPASYSNKTMFIPDVFNYTAYTEACIKNYGLTPKYDYALNEYGGFNPATDLKAYSNIIFSNGNLDPWSGGGVTNYVNLFLPVYTISGAAHHLDLRLPNEADKGTDVEWVRQKEANLIEMWVKQYQASSYTAKRVSKKTAFMQQ